MTANSKKWILWSMNELLVFMCDFMCDGAPVRGEIVSIGSAWQAVLERRDDPPAIRKILGDLLDASNTGRLVITLDPTDREPGQPPYQGIVALQEHVGSSVKPVSNAAEAICLYMQNSEQLDTRIWLASDDSHIGGLLLQRLPNSGGHAHLDPEVAEEGWSRIKTLGETITNEELLTLPSEIILRRLFLEESTEKGVRSFPPRPVRFACRCSRNKVADVLRMLGEEEVQSILAEQGVVETICDFCAKPYRFDAVDCLQVFKTDLLSDATRPPSSGH